MSRKPETQETAIFARLDLFKKTFIENPTPAGREELISILQEYLPNISLRTEIDKKRKEKTDTKGAFDNKFILKEVTTPDGIYSYHKLVRDLIPSQIQSTGKQVDFHTCEDAEEYVEYLKIKLGEEMREFTQNPCPEEAADIVEVAVYLIANNNRTQIT